MIDIKNKEVIEAFKYVLVNRNQWGGDYSFMLDEDANVFTDADGEFEYQIRDYVNGDFHLILVRFCNDTTHTYMEFRDSEYENIYDLIYDALSDETMETLAARVEKKWMVAHND